MMHEFIKTGDSDVFPAIQDRNGEVVLDYCRKCRKAEGELEPGCLEIHRALVILEREESLPSNLKALLKFGLYWLDEYKGSTPEGELEKHIESVLTELGYRHKLSCPAHPGYNGVCTCKR